VEHSILAQSFAFAVAVLAASGWVRLYQVFWIGGEILRGCSS
jgi:hypothetical protein